MFASRKSLFHLGYSLAPLLNTWAYWDSRFGGWSFLVVASSRVVQDLNPISEAFVLLGGYIVARGRSWWTCHTRTSRCKASDTRTIASRRREFWVSSRRQTTRTDLKLAIQHEHTSQVALILFVGSRRKQAEWTDLHEDDQSLSIPISNRPGMIVLSPLDNNAKVQMGRTGPMLIMYWSWPPVLFDSVSTHGLYMM